LNATRVESFGKKVTRVESESQNVVTRVDSLTRVTLSLVERVNRFALHRQQPFKDFQNVELAPP